MTYCLLSVFCGSCPAVKGREGRTAQCWSESPPLRVTLLTRDNSYTDKPGDGLHRVCHTASAHVRSAGPADRRSGRGEGGPGRGAAETQRAKSQIPSDSYENALAHVRGVCRQSTCVDRNQRGPRSNSPLSTRGVGQRSREAQRLPQYVRATTGDTLSDMASGQVL